MLLRLGGKGLGYDFTRRYVGIDTQNDSSPFSAGKNCRAYIDEEVYRSIGYMERYM